MLTVNIHDLDLNERIIPALEVTKIADGVTSSDGDKSGVVEELGFVTIKHTDGTYESIKEYSCVFVMNDKGTTVAIYKGLPLTSRDFGRS